MNITPIDTLAKECAEEIMIDCTNCDSERLARLAFKERISNAIRQALKEREKFMGHTSGCPTISFTYWLDHQKHGSCDCGYEEASKDLYET